MNDYDITKNTKLLPIIKIAKKLGLKKSDIILYGDDKAKVKPLRKEIPSNKGKLILVTSTNPTPYGEGKTTLSIGLCDSLCAMGKNSVVVLREPSLGPVFGTKGGATGGGLSQVAPMDDINLHFTGDIHAITSANNLLCAIIDNHLFQGNELKINPSTIVPNRCLDVNDRALRKIHLDKVNRDDHFQISVASEIMAILCLSNDIEDLKNRLGNILVGYNMDGNEITVSDLHAEGALTILLKDAIQPNIVQTLENNPAIIHGGPFANIAHGCNSVIATKLGLKLADYVVTEAGFGSDMGALKFLDIKCRMNDLNPDLIIINTTIRSLKYNGDGLLENGIENLGFHIRNMKSFKNNVLVVLNYFDDDTDEEIKYVNDYCINNGVLFEISKCYKMGSKGGVSLANTVLKMLSKENSDLPVLYELKDSINEKILKVCKHLGAKEVEYKEGVQEKINRIEKDNPNLPICIAKTPYSITDKSDKLGCPRDFGMKVTNVRLNKGAGFITVYMGFVMTMPGLSKTANYLNMDIDGGKIRGLF